MASSAAKAMVCGGFPTEDEDVLSSLTGISIFSGCHNLSFFLLLSSTWGGLETRNEQKKLKWFMRFAFLLFLLLIYFLVCL